MNINGIFKAKNCSCFPFTPLLAETSCSCHAAGRVSLWTRDTLALTSFSKTTNDMRQILPGRVSIMGTVQGNHFGGALGSRLCAGHEESISRQLRGPRGNGMNRNSVPCSLNVYLWLAWRGHSGLFCHSTFAGIEIHEAIKTTGLKESLIEILQKFIGSTTLQVNINKGIEFKSKAYCDRPFSPLTIVLATRMANPIPNPSVCCAV